MQEKNHPITAGIDFEDLDSFKRVSSIESLRKLTYWIFAFFGVLILGLFLPWTQNVEGSGVVTTLRPEQQPHTLNAIVGGKIEKWWVIEGQHVKKGDTLALLSEVKNDYMDPLVRERTQEQLDAKLNSIDAYTEKVNVLDMVLRALQREYDQKKTYYTNKVEQYKNKLEVSLVEFETAENNFAIEELRLNRADSLFRVGIKSRKDFESSQLKYQKANNKRNSTQQKLSIARSELVNAQIELDNLLNTFNAKLSKSKSDKYSAITALNDAKKEVAYLRNKVANITIRQGNYYVISPQDSYVLRTYKKGQGGEIVKSGDKLISLVPINPELAIEIYVKPVDLPLIKIGEKIRIIFDGWPSLVFSGWPNSSFGTFSGEVYAIDKTITDYKGKYRILIIPDDTEHEPDWPSALRLGGGAKGMFLLNDVPVWYELWRQINGFPPDFYDGSKSEYKLDKTIDKKYHTK